VRLAGGVGVHGRAIARIRVSGTGSPACAHDTIRPVARLDCLNPPWVGALKFIQVSGGPPHQPEALHLTLIEHTSILIEHRFLYKSPTSEQQEFAQWIAG
jgi:hypothetical protein